MEDWRRRALNEIEELKPYWVRKYDWQPELVETDEAVDLFVRLRSRRLDGRIFLLNLHYLAEWQVAGRREAFVNPDDRTEGGPEFWPHGVRGVNPSHRPNENGPIIPCICIRGAWGYHSLLHANETPDGTKLLEFLVELQGVLDE